MQTTEIAPGSILQRMYLKSRFKDWKIKGTFLEIGSGTGYISKLFLENNLKGIGLDLNNESCKINTNLNNLYIEQQKYQVLNENFLQYDFQEKFDVIISCMVIEHMNEEDVHRYFTKATKLLNPNGVIVSLVPSSMKHWGIEDEIAGHFKRYTFECFNKISQKYSLRIIKNVGLTYPLSNFLLPLSNYLVNKSEKSKLVLNKQEQTVLSSNRKVFLKTNFPSFLRLVLNEYTMYPLYILQSIFRNNKNSLVIYSELQLKNE